MIQPSFHRSILEKFAGTFTDASQSLLLKLKQSQQEINITHFINNCVMDILNGKYTKVDVGRVLTKKVSIRYFLNFEYEQIEDSFSTNQNTHIC